MTTEEKQPLVTDDETLWNVLIYMAADNNLKEECVYALTEIEKAGITPGIRIVAQLDSGDAINRFDFSKLKAAKGFSQLVTRRTNTILKAINGQEGSQSDEIRQKILSDKNAQSDSKMLGEFLSETIIEGHNMVVLSGHGSGAVGDFLGDDKSPSSLSIPTLKSVLESVREQIGHKINVLGMDSCLMSMVEVCYELRDQVEFLVGAEGFERNAGWPYLEIVKVLQANMKALKDDPQTALKEIVRQIVREYVNYYFPYHISGVSVDLAACDLRDSGNVEMLKAKVGKLAQVLRDNLSNEKVKNAIVVAHWKAQSYKFEQYVDLWDFCNLLRDDLIKGIYGEADLQSDWGKVKSEIENACRDVKSAVEKIVAPSCSCYSGAAFQHSHGLSIYFPWAKSDLDRDLECYGRLLFAQATKWDEFLKDYGKQTQREVRDDNNNREIGIDPIPMPARSDSGTAVRMNPQASERMNPQASERGERVIVAQVKNPPNEFYEDDCLGNLEKSDITTSL